MPREPSSSFIRRIWSAIPVTLTVVLIAVGLHCAVKVRSGTNPDSARAYREWGLLEVQRSADHPELFGPFDLWAGEWWRVPLGGLHHAGWWHLLMNGSVLIYLGTLLEPRLRRSTFALLILGALVITGLARWRFGADLPFWVLGESSVLGLSGVLFALLGTLLVLKRQDESLARQLDGGVVWLGWGVGLGLLLFSALGLVRGIDHLSHLAGLLYGGVWGMVLAAPPAILRIAVVGLLAAHGVLWQEFDRVMHPLEDGRYHWWLAESSDDPAIREACYRAAVRCDPSLEHPWFAWAESQLQNRRPDEAWQTLLQGLHWHPEGEHAQSLGPRIWNEFATLEQRQSGWEAVRRMFPDQARQFQTQLLSPRQSATFLLTHDQPLEAWQSLMGLLRELSPPPDRETWRLENPEVSPLAESIWRRFTTPRQRQRALMRMDELLEEKRRPWHLLLIPQRELILHYRGLGESLWAWQAVLEEMRDDSEYRPQGKKLAREIWQALPTELRRDRAQNLVREIFGVRGLEWQIELGILSEQVRQQYRLDQSIRLPDVSLGKYPTPLLQPVLDPDDPSSASEGVRL